MDHDTGVQDSDDRAWGTVGEVAAVYGVSADTIRRRMRRGDLEARRVEIPSGFKWMLPMPAPGDTLPGSAPVPAPATDHAAMVEVLQGELAARNAEIERLHALLDTQARALEAVAARPALPAPQDHAADDPQPDTPDTGSDTETDTAAGHSVSIWGRLRRWYRMEG